MPDDESLPPERHAEDFTLTVKQLPEKEYAEKTNAGKMNPIKWVASVSKSNQLVKSFEAFFKWEGEMVSHHAVKVLIACVFFSALGWAGLPFLHTENNMIRLWIPQTSDFALNYAWLWSTYPPEFRQHSLILHGDDVLTPPAIQKMYKIFKEVNKIRTEKHNKTWEDVCFRRPVLKLSQDMFDQKRRKRSPFEDDDFFDDFADNFDELSQPADFSIENYPEPYCGMVESLPTACFHESILELWAHEGEFNQKSDEMIAQLTKEDIIKKVNNWGYSELYLAETDFKPQLGGVTKDSAGNIVAAKALIMKWMGRMNATKALEQGASDGAGTADLLDSETAEFETMMSQVLLETRDIEPTNLHVEVNVANSFGQIASSTIMTDVTNFIIGFCIVFTYVNIMLGRFNLVEQRMFISLMGLASVAMAIFFSYGICSVMGLFFGPLHNIIPFLLLGIGIDDMFVTAQCFNTLPEDVKSKGLKERMGETMLRAGSAITITSITDFLAFMIGGTTVLPALKSFCIFCAVGIIVVYILQATWFVAWFSLDQRRIESHRNGTIPCYVHKNYTPNSMSQKNYLETAFAYFAKLLVKTPVKILVLLFTSATLGVSIWGNIELRQEFNPIWFLPPDSYLAQWHQYSAQYFPSIGEEVTVFMGDLQLPAELDKLEEIHSGLADQSDIITSVDSWYNGFKKYMDTNFKDDGSIFSLDEDQFNERLTQYLFSPHGSQYRFLFTFEKSLKCGEKSPVAQLSMMNFRHKLMDGPSQQIPAMNRAKTIFREANFTGKVFPMAAGYASWETDEIISVELYRNMFLAVVCIFITCWILLFNFYACCQVLICVILTLVNVAGFMHFWGLTIDTVSCTNLIIAIGLCVDYSAHIAHSFMMNTGSRNTRMREALRKIGPAVLNGGFSTFLAFVLLAGSRSHVFQTFFKVFFLVVMFGMYNGLVFLPTLLSICGPRSYNHKEELNSSPEEVQPLKPIIKHSSQGDSHAHTDQQTDSHAHQTNSQSEKVNGDASNGVVLTDSNNAEGS